jgi:hypothetical protein
MSQMNRNQIAIKLTADTLNYDLSNLTKTQYRDFCAELYLLRQRGVYICGSRLELNREKLFVYSPLSLSHFDTKASLLTDIEEIVQYGSPAAFQGWQLDKKTRQRIRKYKREKEKEGGLVDMLKKSF